MKKTILILSLIAIVLSLSACGSKEKYNQNNKTQSELISSEIKHTNKKITGEITSASVYSEGLAFVCTDGNKDKAYCIDEQGNIVFELENKIQSAMGTIYNKFTSGITLVDGGICNTKGEIVYPQDVGATQFFSIALEGGYIVATKVTADYSSSKKEMGVMNKDFDWVVEPSEELYSELEQDLLTTTPLNTKSFYSDGYIYFENCKRFLEIKTGKVSESASIEIPSSKWVRYSNNTFGDDKENIIVDLNQYKNVESTGSNNYKKGKVPVIFYNQEINKRFWSLADEKGKLLFEPVEMVNFTEFMWSRIKFDGETTVFYDSAAKKLTSFNVKGELISELGIDDLSSVDIENGVILITRGGANSKKCEYYNTDFTKKF